MTYSKSDTLKIISHLSKYYSNSKTGEVFVLTMIKNDLDATWENSYIIRYAKENGKSISTINYKIEVIGNHFDEAVYNMYLKICELEKRGIIRGKTWIGGLEEHKDLDTMNTQTEKTKHERSLDKLFDKGTLFGEIEDAEKAKCTHVQPIKCKALYGHLYNLENRKRIVFVEGTTCELHHAQYKHPKEENVFDLTEIKAGYFKLLEKNTILYFDLLQPLEKEKDKDLKKEHKKYRFKCELLEDLYVKRTKKEGYRLHPCQCKTVSSNDVKYFEVVFGKTLAELFRKTSILYNESYTSANVKVTDRFFLENEDDLETICDKMYAERLSKAKPTAKDKTLELEKNEWL